MGLNMSQISDSDLEGSEGKQEARIEGDVLYSSRPPKVITDVSKQYKSLSVT